MAAGPRNGGLTELVNKALQQLRRNGKLDALRARWFGG
jgi:ABC-type amino acid transport substrate-binding protein